MLIRSILRRSTRKKSFTAINLLGLTVGTAVAMFVAQLVWFEYSFDRHIPDSDRIYRVNLYNTNNGVFDQISAGTVSGLAADIRENIPAVESVARLSSLSQGIVANPERQVEDLEGEIAYADPDILELLGLNLLDGGRKKALQEPQTILISETAARKYFGSLQATGKILKIGFNNNSLEKQPYEVRGVFKDIPANANRHFQFLLPPESRKAWDENWAWSNVETYLSLPVGTSPEALDGGLAAIVKQRHTGTGDRYLLEPVTAIRLHALDGTGRASTVRFYLLLGAAILFLAWFNYINLSTARFFERMKEIGVRKLIGAQRHQLIRSFLAEALAFNVFAFLLAAGLFRVSRPVVFRFLDHPPAMDLPNPALLGGIAILAVLLGTAASGLIPAMFLSSFQPLQSLKGELNDMTDRSTLRKVMVTLQLGVTIVLLTAVLAIRRQVDFLHAQDPGIAIDQTLVIDPPLMTDGTSVQAYEPFKNEVLRMPSVKGVTYASSFPGSEIDWHRSDITLDRENADYRYDSRIIAIGTEFPDVFGLQLAAGRNFNPEIESDNTAMLINEEAVGMFGFLAPEDALGRLIFIGSRKFETIGVLKNYHFRSFEHALQPLLFIEGFPRGPGYAVKLGTGDLPGTLTAIRERWENAYAGNVFRYRFLDEVFDRQYAADRQSGRIVGALTALAILISCSGLFGLILFSANRRRREIGIRKVLGATTARIVLLFSKDFMLLALIAGCIAIPPAYHYINRWLDHYAAKMPVTAGLFLIPVLIVFLLTLATTGFQAMAAASRNPVGSLKDE